MHYSESASLVLVRLHQPTRNNHIRPSTLFARRLKDAVERQLLETDPSQLQFFTAVGSPLDRYYGIDAFFEWRGFRVTFDVTINPKKKTSKADLIYYQTDDIKWFASEIACKFHEQMRERRRMYSRGIEGVSSVQSNRRAVTK